VILHVACLPFPSYQGTQAALAAMLEASAATGEPTHLLTYAQAAYELDAPYEVHRIPDFPKVRSLRSGPSWGKIGLDARCIVEVRRLARRLQPKAIVAHHIEAALAALAAQAAPVYYVAHTSLARELPVYFPSLPASFVSGVSERVLPFVAGALGQRSLQAGRENSVCTLGRRSSHRAFTGSAPRTRHTLPAGPVDRTGHTAPHAR